MADDVQTEAMESVAAAPVSAAPEKEDGIRIYELGYHVIPTVAEESLEKTIGDFRSIIEKAGGHFIAEGAPALTKLAYDMDAREGDKRVTHDKGYFGWIKFESSIEAAQALDAAMKTNPSILRHILFTTVREDTRARLKMATVREVRRTDKITSSPRRTEETSAPVSEADLEKALSDITTE